MSFAAFRWRCLAISECNLHNGHLMLPVASDAHRVRPPPTTDATEESQRDSTSKPRVARQGHPGYQANKRINPEGVAPARDHRPRPRRRLPCGGTLWTFGRNPVGVVNPVGRHTQGCLRGNLGLRDATPLGLEPCRTAYPGWLVPREAGLRDATPLGLESAGPRPQDDESRSDSGQRQIILPPDNGLGIRVSFPVANSVRFDKTMTNRSRPVWHPPTP